MIRILKNKMDNLDSYVEINNDNLSTALQENKFYPVARFEDYLYFVRSKEIIDFIKFYKEVDNWISIDI